MEDGDSAHSEHTHRSSNNAGHDFVHGTWTVQFLRKPLPNPSPKREGLFGRLLVSLQSIQIDLHKPSITGYCKGTKTCTIGSAVHLVVRTRGISHQNTPTQPNLRTISRSRLRSPTGIVIAIVSFSLLSLVGLADSNSY